MEAKMTKFHVGDKVRFTAREDRKRLGYRIERELDGHTGTIASIPTGVYGTGYIEVEFPKAPMHPKWFMVEETTLTKL